MLGSLVKLDEQRRRHTDLTQRLIRVMAIVFLLWDELVLTDDAILDAEICPSSSIQGLPTA